VATGAVEGRQDAFEKPTAELVGDLAHELTSLLRHEIELAQAEMTERGKRAGMGAGIFGAGAVLALFGAGCLTACAVAALHLVVSVWLAALIVGGVLVAAAAVAALAGRSEVRRATPPVPTEAVESTKEDVRWLKTQAKSARQ
jgi:hypothetical protein